MKYFFIVLGLGFAVLTYQYIAKKYNLPDDNIIEQDLEEVIKMETGVQIDLTPKSQEVGSN